MATLTRTKVINAIPKTGGVINEMAKKLKVTRGAVYKFLSKPQNYDIEVMRIAEIEAITDNAETEIIKAIDNGEAWAVKWWLRTMCKNRGFSGINVNGKIID